jgi:hypothetical protein
MAARYWVGGAGTWDASSTTHWSTASSGASGASAPTSADNVIFDQAASYTVTVSTGAVCADLTVSTGTPTFGGSGNLSVSGSLALNATSVWSNTGTTTFAATAVGKTINTAGVNMAGHFTFDGVGGGWALSGAFTMTTAGGNFTLTNGSFNMNGFNLTVMNFVSNGTTARTFTMGSGTLTANYTVVSINTTNLTLNPGTSTLNLAAASSSSCGLTVTGAATFYNVTCGVKTVSITGSLTCTNFTVSPATGGGAHDIAVNGSVTVTGSVSMNGGDAQNPTYFHGLTASVTAAITAAAWPSPADIIFAFVAVTGAAAPITVTRGGDAGVNSGVTLPAAKTVYWNNAAAAQWWSTSFATTAAGAPAINNQPLPQDTVIVGAAGSGLPATLIWTTGYCSTLDFSPLSTALALTLNSMSIFGDLTLSANLTLASSPYTILFKKVGGTQTLTTAGITIRTNLSAQGVGGTLNLVGALVVAPPSGAGLTITDCSFNTGGYNITTTALSLSGSVARTATFGASVITLTDVAGTILTVGSNLTINAGTSKIKVQPSGAATALALSFGSGLVFNDLEFALASASGVLVNIVGIGCTFNNITGTQSVPATINFQGGQTFNLLGGFTLSGQSGAILALGATTASQMTIRKASPWKVGANSADGGNNAGLQFVAGHSDYLNVSYLNGFDTTAGGGLFFGSNF